MSVTNWPIDRPSDVLVRVYGGSSQDKLIVAFQRDAESLLAQGYEPSGQYYVPGTWPAWWIALIVLSCLVLIGFLIAIRLLLGPRPTGALVVTYVRHQR